MSPAKEETVARLKEQIGHREEDDLAIGEILLEEEVAAETNLSSEIEEVEEEEEVEQRSSTREYVILCQQAGKKELLIVSHEHASNAEGAVLAIGEDNLDDGATYVAVPVRNWNQLPPVSKQTKTTISFK